MLSQSDSSMCICIMCIYICCSCDFLNLERQTHAVRKQSRFSNVSMALVFQNWFWKVHKLTNLLFKFNKLKIVIIHSVLNFSETIKMVWWNKYIWVELFDRMSMTLILIAVLCVMKRNCRVVQFLLWRSQILAWNSTGYVIDNYSVGKKKHKK